MRPFEMPPGYDAWKTRVPETDYDEPEFECAECEDTAYVEPGELCPYCQQPMTLDDLETLDMEKQQ